MKVYILFYSIPYEGCSEPLEAFTTLEEAKHPKTLEDVELSWVQSIDDEYHCETEYFDEYYLRVFEI